MMRFLAAGLFFFSFLSPAFAQNGYGPRSAGEMVIAIVPMIGSGTYEDPRRPQLVPLRRMTGEEPLDYRFVLSDDGKMAIVAFRAPMKAKLSSIVESRRQGMRVFERGKDTRAEVEQEARRYRKDFQIEELLGIPAAPVAREVKP